MNEIEQQVIDGECPRCGALFYKTEDGALCKWCEKDRVRKLKHAEIARVNHFAKNGNRKQRRRMAALARKLAKGIKK